MNVNGMTSNRTTDYTTTVSASQKKTSEEKAASTSSASEGVIYEPSKNDTTSTTNTTTAEQRSAIVAQLKADAEERANQLQQLVTQMISKQGNSFGQATDMWKFLASGNYTVDAATKSQAQKDIADGGYWSVEKTSDRILDFAKALSGGDPDKMKEMCEAFQKGFKEATHAWGKDLPSISQNTYDSVIQKFDQWSEENTKTN